MESTLSILLRIKDETSVALGKIIEELRDVNKNSKDTAVGMQALSDTVTGFGNSVVGVAGKVKQLVAALLGLAVVAKLKDLADAAARTEVLGTVLNVVGNNAGFTIAQLRGVEKQVVALGITTRSARESLTQLIQSGLITNANTEKATQLARAAQDLAVVSGQNSSETLQRLTVNIQQMDTVGTKNMGLIISREEAERKYQTTVLKSTVALSEQQKQQAFLNEVLDQANKLSGTYEASLGDVAKQAQSLSRFQEELKVTLGNGLLPAYLALVEVYTDFLKQMKLASSELGNQGEGAIALGQAVRALAEGIKNIIVAVVQYKEVLLTLAAVYALLRVNTVFTALASAFGAAQIAAVSLTATVGGMNVVLLQTSTLLNALIGGAAFGGMSRLAAATALFTTALKGAIPVLAAFAVGFSVGEFLNGFETIRNAASAVVTVLLDGFGLVGDAVDIMVNRVKASYIGLFTFLPGEAGRAARAAADRFNKEAELAKSRSGQRVERVQDSVGTVAGPKTDQDKLITDAADVVTKLEDTKDKLRDAAAELEKAKAVTFKDGIGEKVAKQAVAEAQARLDGYTADVKKYSTQLADIKKQAVGDTKDKITAFQFDSQLSVKNAANALAAVEKEIADAKKNLGLDKLVLFQDTQVSADFNNAVGDLQKIMKRNDTPFITQIGSQSKVAATSLLDLENAFDSAAEKAKSSAEIAALIGLITPQAEAASQRIANLKETLQFNQAKAAVAEAEKGLAGFINRIKEMQSSADTLRGIEDDIRGFAGSIQGLITEFGSALAISQNGLVSYAGTLKTVQATRSQLADAEIANNQRTSASAKAKYDSEIAGIKALEVKAIQDINGKKTGEKEKADAILAIQRDSIDKQIAASKTYYDSEKSSRENYVNQVRDSMQRIASLDSEIANNRRSLNSALFDLQISGLSQLEQRQRQSNRASILSSEVQTNLAQGNLTAAKASADEQLRMAQALAGSAKTEQERLLAGMALTEAYSNQEKIIQRTKADEEERLKKNLAAMNGVTNSVTELSKGLRELVATKEIKTSVLVDDTQIRTLEQELAQPKTLTLSVQVDPLGLSNIRKTIEDSLKGIAVSLSLKADASGAPGKAKGGLLSGPGTGTSDSILMWGSNGEFVQTAEATRFWGLDFMQAINEKRLPRFAAGGVVGGGSSSAEGSSMGSIDITMNKKAVGRFMGSRDDLNNLVSALKTVSRGV